MVEGTVKWFDKKKGYGFIALNGNPDVFVHYTSFADRDLKTLNEGDIVVFEVVQGEKGPRADKVALKPA
ncbi:MAG: cold-shock protein [Phycisphaerae bacterium]|nr:cold-shock protein [Phycisphaerae bacterium]